MKVIKSDSVDIPILTDDKFDKIEEFAGLVKQVQEWMLKNHNLHSKVIIEATGATVTTDKIFIPLKVGD